MLSELMHYKHHILSAKITTFVTITKLGLMVCAFMHSTSIFLGACIIPWVAFQFRFLQLFMISIKVHSQITLLGTYILAWVTFLLSLCQTLLNGSCASAFSMYPFWNIYIHTYPTGTPDLCLSSDGLLWFPSICLCNFFYYIYLYSHWVHSCSTSVSISTFTWSYHKVPTGNKGSKILTGITWVGSWQNYQVLNRSSFFPRMASLSLLLSH